MSAEDAPTAAELQSNPAPSLVTGASHPPEDEEPRIPGDAATSGPKDAGAEGG